MQLSPWFDQINSLKLQLDPRTFISSDKSLNWLTKINFLAIKPSINSIKPWIKFNWVHKYLILDFSSSNWIFLINRALTVKFQPFAFLNLLNQFWHFFSISAILFSLLLFFGFLLIYIYIYFLYFLIFMWTQKWVTTDAPSLQCLRSKNFA